LVVKPGDGESFVVEQVIQKRVAIEVLAAWLERGMQRVA